MKILILKTDAVMPKGFSIHCEHGGLEEPLFVLFRAPAMLWVDGAHRLVGAGDGIFFGYHQMQSYYAIDGVEFNHDFMYFEPETEYERLLYEQIPKNTLIREQVPGELTECLFQMEKEMTRPGRYQKEILSNLGTAFLYKASGLAEADGGVGQSNRSFPDLYNLRRELYKKPYLEWTVEAMAQSVQMSRSYFEHLYKQFFSVSCIGDLIFARVEYAKVLLLHRDMPVWEVAQQCGYKNTEHFIRQFKKHIGVSPNQFRKEQGEKRV